MRALLAAALVLAVVRPVAASDPPPVQARTSLEDVRSCTALRGGGYAVATGGGLALVREGRVRTLTALEGLPETRVHVVVESAEGLWVGTERGAALVALGAEPRVVRTVLDEPVRAIALPYVGTWGGGVVRIDDGVKRVPSTSKRVSALTMHEGALWAAWMDGPVTKLEGGAFHAVAGPRHGQALASVDGKLMLGDLSGTFRIEGMKAYGVGSADVRGFAGDLVATYGGGLLRGPRREAGVPDRVQGVSAGCAATTEGLFVREGDAWRHVALGEGPPSNDVTVLAPNGDRVAVGTFDGGAAIARAGTFTRIEGLSAGETVNAAAWEGEVLWLGTARGLVRVEGDHATVRHPHAPVRALLPLEKGRLVVGAEDGAFTFEGGDLVPLVATKKGTRAPLDSPMHATWALAKDGATLYVGTTSGLYAGAPGGAWRRFSVATGELTDDWVTALVTGKEGVFVGTYAGGVVRIGSDGKAAPLGGGYVNPDGLTLHGGRLFVATMDGLLVKPAADASPLSLRTGLATGRDVTAARFVGDAAWIASRRGIAIARMAL